MPRSEGTIYLLHFSQPYAHAKHYIGYASPGHLDSRLEEHRRGTGARLMQVIREAGIDFTVARTWEGGRTRERQLKRQGGASRCCPLCKEIRR